MVQLLRSQVGLIDETTINTRSRLFDKHIVQSNAALPVNWEIFNLLAIRLHPQFIDVK